jgi:hypothetical protein
MEIAIYGGRQCKSKQNITEQKVLEKNKAREVNGRGKATSVRMLGAALARQGISF